MLKFQLSLMFYLTKCVSSISARFLFPGAHAVFICVQVAILDSSIVCVPDGKNSDKTEVEFYCGFDWHFLYDQGC
jgi:hypothetical protein